MGMIGSTNKDGSKHAELQKWYGVEINTYGRVVALYVKRQQKTKMVFNPFLRRSNPFHAATDTASGGRFLRRPASSTTYAKQRRDYRTRGSVFGQYSFDGCETLHVAHLKVQRQQCSGRIQSLRQGKVMEVVIYHGSIGSSWLTRARRGILKAHLGADAKKVQEYLYLHDAELARKKTM